MTLVLLSLAAVIVLYFIFAFLPIKICAICGAVSLIWLGLLIGLFLGWHDNVLWIATMMGGSIVGLMYKLEKYFLKKQLSNFWLIRILIIVLGFLSVYLLLVQIWSLFGLVLALSIILIFLSLFFVRKKKAGKEKPFDKGRKDKALKRRLDNLVQQLENCCED